MAEPLCWAAVEGGAVGALGDKLLPGELEDAGSFTAVRGAREIR